MLIGCVIETVEVVVCEIGIVAEVVDLCCGMTRVQGLFDFSSAALSPLGLLVLEAGLVESLLVTQVDDEPARVC